MKEEGKKTKRPAGRPVGSSIKKNQIVVTLSNQMLGQLDEMVDKYGLDRLTLIRIAIFEKLKEWK